MKIQTCDGRIHQVDTRVARVSFKLRKMLENDSYDDAKPIKFENENVCSFVFEKIIEWCSHHVDDPNVDNEVDVDDDYDDDIFSDWDEDWIDSLDEELLFGVILAADHLGIKMLLELGSKRVASSLETLSIEEIRKRYNLKNDFAPEEERRIRAQLGLTAKRLPKAAASSKYSLRK